MEAALPAYLLSVLLSFFPHFQSHTGPATIYWPGDGMCGSERADGRPFKRSDGHIAHRYFPLGTAGYVCNKRTQLCAWTVVRDRGPFGQVRKCASTTKCTRDTKPRCVRWVPWSRRAGCWYWQARTRPHPAWRYRGDFDLTRPVARAIQHRPFDVVIFYYWRPAGRVPTT